MNRRSFIKRGALFVPTIFVPRLIHAQTILTADGLAALRKQPASGGGGGGGGSTPFITSFPTGSTGAGFNGKIGMKFTPNFNITITSLGRNVASGNSQSHVLRLWDAGTAGTTCGAELASVTVNLAGQTAGTFVYGSITPVSIVTSNIYYVFSDEASGGDSYLNDNVIVTTTADATINFSAFFDTSCHVSTSGSRSYGPVNFQYTKP